MASETDSLIPRRIQDYVLEQGHVDYTDKSIILIQGGGGTCLAEGVVVLFDKEEF